MAFTVRSRNLGETVQSPRHSHAATRPHVVVVFGRTGVGISSLINLIVGYPSSQDHSNAKPTKPTIQCHLASIPSSNNRDSNKEFWLYEVPGFGGHVPNTKIRDMILEIERDEGIDLFIYCFRKQRTTVLPANTMDLVRNSVPGPGVPMIAVVTELERFEAKGGMDEWWNTSLEGGATNGTRVEQICFEDNGKFDEHACITTLPPREVDLSKTLSARRDVSEELIRRLIRDQCREPKREPDRGLDGPNSHGWLHVLTCGIF